MKEEKNDLYGHVADDLIAQIKDLLNQRANIERRIDDLRDTLAKILKVSNTEVMDYVLSDIPSGLSAACTALIKYSDKPITPVEIRDSLVRMNFSGVHEYANLLATIHTTLKRMEKKGLILLKENNGKTGYVWNDAQYAR